MKQYNKKKIEKFDAKMVYGKGSKEGKGGAGL